jgi:hypothetical protein
MSDTPPNPPSPDVDDNIDANGEQVAIRRKQGFWARLGGGGLMVSLMIHFFLVVVAVFWVVSTWTDSTKREPTQFATGAGGGNDGDRAKIYQHRLQQKNMKSLAKSTPRLTSKNPNSAISLPDIPNVSTSSMVSGATLGGSSKGFGGGSGGGIGSGQGIGVGNGRNMIGKFKPVMGAKIEATKIAVFMDASDSMQRYISKVESEIRKQFPNADVFKYKGAWTNLIGNTIMGGAKYNGKLTELAQVEKPEYRTNPETLSPKGKSIFIQHDKDFKTGCVGAWLDIMNNQKEYDALIIFSDFQDGVTQYREKEKGAKYYYGSDKFEKVYSDGTRSNLPTDDRTEQEKAWERQWVKIFTQAKTSKGPRLYIFSSDQEPQPIFEKCVQASGGQIVMARWLNPNNKYGDKPPVDNTDSVEIKKSSVSTPASTTR